MIMLRLAFASISVIFMAHVNFVKSFNTDILERELTISGENVKDIDEYSMNINLDNERYGFPLPDGWSHMKSVQKNDKKSHSRSLNQNMKEKSTLKYAWISDITYLGQGCTGTPVKATGYLNGTCQLYYNNSDSRIATSSYQVLGCLNPKIKIWPNSTNCDSKHSIPIIIPLEKGCKTIEASGETLYIAKSVCSSPLAADTLPVTIPASVTKM